MSQSTFLERISAPGFGGALIRVALLTIALSVALAISLLVRSVAGIGFSNAWMLGMFGVAWLGAVLGSLFSEYPAGDEKAMVRVGLATFCRIGVPLVAVLLICSYSVQSFAAIACAFLGGFYIVGLIVGVLLSVFSLSRISSTTPNPIVSESNEVDRATV